LKPAVQQVLRSRRGSQLLAAASVGPLALVTPAAHDKQKFILADAVVIELPEGTLLEYWKECKKRIPDLQFGKPIYFNRPIIPRVRDFTRFYEILLCLQLCYVPFMFCLQLTVCDVPWMYPNHSMTSMSSL
jgi:hypothetical protein